MKKTFLVFALFALSAAFSPSNVFCAEEKDKAPAPYYIQYDFWSGIYATQGDNEKKYFFQSKEYDEIFLNNPASSELMKQSYFNRGVGTALLISSILIPIAELVLFGLSSNGDAQAYRNSTYVAAGSLLALTLAAEIFIEISYNQMFRGINEYNKAQSGEKHSGNIGQPMVSLNYKFR